MKTHTITTEDSIKKFFAYIHKRYKRPFLPEDDLSQMTDAQGKLLFTPGEAAYLDDVMLYCFVFCFDHSLDIHKIAAEVQAQPVY
ncbi:hypothetical protein V9K67_17225 [Paraflavisolibacter sp. H34]|uniref:hypothetical protein n=1 Tax=Huijunlia imazamoxiresistens TaxID=3127457 RepID=UPI0030198170